MSVEGSWITTILALAIRYVKEGVHRPISEDPVSPASLFDEYQAGLLLVLVPGNGSQIVRRSLVLQL
jgi:hypothetical protein